MALRSRFGQVLRWIFSPTDGVDLKIGQRQSSCRWSDFLEKISILKSLGIVISRQTFSVGFSVFQKLTLKN